MSKSEIYISPVLVGEQPIARRSYGLVIAHISSWLLENIDSSDLIPPCQQTTSPVAFPLVNLPRSVYVSFTIDLRSVVLETSVGSRTNRSNPLPIPLKRIGTIQCFHPWGNR